MSRWSIRLKLLAAIAAGALAAVAAGAVASHCFSPRAIRMFAGSRFFFPNEFSRDGSLLLGRIYHSADETDPLAVWDTATGEQLVQYTDLPREARFAPDGRLAFVDEDGRLVLRNPRALSEHVTSVGGLQGETTPVFSPKGTLVATTRKWVLNARGGKVRLWDLATGKGRVLIEDSQNARQVLVLQFSPDGRKLGALSENGTVRIWETDTGVERGHYKIKMGFGPSWLSPNLDKVVITDYWCNISSSDDDDGDSGEETTLWALPSVNERVALKPQAPVFVQAVGFTRYWNRIRWVDSSVRVGRISTVTFTDEGRVLGTSYAFEKGLLGWITNGIIKAGDSDVLVVWDIDDGWRKVGIIPTGSDGIISQDGQFVAVATRNFGGIELWPLAPPLSPTRWLAGLAAAAGLLTAASVWWLSGGRRRSLEEMKVA